MKVEPELSFVQISDIHLRTGGASGWWLSERPEHLLEKAVERVNELGDVDFVLFTGDLFDKAEAAALVQFQRIVAALACPYYICVGNHDVVGSPWPGRLTKQMFAQQLALPEKLYYSVPLKPGFRLIVLDTVPPAFPHAQGGLPGEQMDWLRWQLRTHRDEKLLIALHHPPVAPAYFRDFRLNPADGAEFAALIADAPNVVAVLSGHLHVPRRWSYRRRPYFSAPSLGGPPNAFRYFKLEVSARGASLRYDWVAVAPLAQRRPLWYPLSLGSRRDRRGRYRLQLPVFGVVKRRRNLGAVS